MAQLEMLLDCDPEDHFEGVNLLALCYIATEEWDAFDDLAIDLTEKSAEAVVARLWASLRQEGVLDKSLVSLLKSRHKAFYAELIASEHQSAEAREWWLLTEPLWREFPELIEALRK